MLETQRSSVSVSVTSSPVARVSSVSRQICDFPERSETKAMRRESGDQRGRVFQSPYRVRRRGSPSASGSV
jgi:hypothetical protein